MECLFTRAMPYENMSEYINLLRKNNIYYRSKAYKHENGDTCFRYYVHLEDIEKIMEAIDNDVVVYRKDEYQKETMIQVYDWYVD